MEFVSKLPVGEWVDCPLQVHVSTVSAAIRRGLIKHRDKIQGLSLFDRQIKWGQVMRVPDAEAAAK